MLRCRLWKAAHEQMQSKSNPYRFTMSEVKSLFSKRFDCIKRISCRLLYAFARETVASAINPNFSFGRERLMTEGRFVQSNYLLYMPSKVYYAFAPVYVCCRHVWGSV
jgi:hypothetical protein